MHFLSDVTATGRKGHSVVLFNGWNVEAGLLLPGHLV